MSEHLNASASAEAVLVARPQFAEELEAKGFYSVVCYGPDGVEKWRDDFKNLVFTAGKNYLLDNALAGSSFTAAYYMGFVDGGSTPTYNAADTAASHAGWSENTNYTSATRPAVTWVGASAGAKASNSVSFSINTNSQTIAGVLLSTNSTKGGTSGTLISAGSFSGGNRSCNNGDTLAVTYSLTI